MAFQLQQLLSRGTSTPAVARTMLQGKDIIQFIKGTDEQRQDAISGLAELMKKLIRCVEIHEQIAKAVDDARSGISNGSLVIQPQANVLRPPSIPDLDSKAESFLQAAKLAIAQATRLTEPFYDQDFGHQLHKMEKWVTEKFGKDHPLVQFAQGWQPWVKEILLMRDAVDHPKKKPRGRLHVRNFFVENRQGQLVLFAPQWWLEGDAMQPITENMGNIIEGVIQLHEHLLIVIFNDLKMNFPLAMYEIPIEQRNPICPIRLKVSLSDKVKLPEV